MGVCLFESYLDINILDRLDLDVFLLNASDNLRCYTKNNGKCCHFQFSEFARDLFATFCSAFVRLYLNYITDYFSGLFSRIYLSDEKEIIEKFFRHASNLLNKVWDESNYKFFYDRFSTFSLIGIYLWVTHTSFPYSGFTESIMSVVTEFLNNN